jgi:VIT1/CCC1 family predicted Fe2+/Mn2+ transporter
MGGVPAIVVVLVASLLGADTALAVNLALWLTVIELGVVGYLGARAAGSSPRRAVRESLAAALLGVVMVVSKTFLH